ncbi:MAG: type I 3-dehydroquinate dehydratase, partial [Thermoplasmata archaeon]|nr:type I 3-dehydroquinate dehydratase [Thermoplasmata archaeon]
MPKMEIWANIVESDPSRIISAGNRAFEEGASAVVVRMDVVREWDESTARFIAHGVHGKTIASLRSRWQGGFFNGDEDERSKELGMLVDSGFTMIELEADIDAIHLRKLVARARNNKMRVVFFFNSFAGPLPAEALSTMITGHYKVGDVFSVGAPVRNRRDMDALLQSAMELSKAGIDACPVGMGDYGYFSSFLAPLIDSRFACGTPEDTASKNVEASVIGDIHGAWKAFPPEDLIITRPSHTTLIGGLVHYTFSSPVPLLYNLVFSQRSAEEVYVPLAWGRRSVEDLIDMAVDMEMPGFHVGVGLQKPIIGALDDVGSLARTIQAVDTVVIRGEEIKGYDTRFYGYLGLTEELPVSIKDQNVLVLGSGGELRSAVAAFVKKGANVRAAMPKKKDEEDVSEVFEERCRVVPWANRKKYLSPAKIIVLTPSLRTKEPFLDPEDIRGRKILIDLQTRKMEPPGKRQPGEVLRFTISDL